MASLNGVTIRNLKGFNGHEGEPLFQGSVYLNGQKLGFWSQDAHGGSDNYDFNTKALETPVLMWKSALKSSKYYEYLDADGFLAVVCGLMQIEKGFKKAVKSGYPVSCFSINVLDGMGSMSSFLHKSVAENNKSAVENDVLKYMDKKEYSFLITRVVSSVDDLNIIVGTMDGAKNEKKIVEEQENERLKRIENEKQERKIKEEKIKNNGRFNAVPDNSNPCMIIIDTKTGKKAKVPMYAYKDTMNVLIELFCK